MPQKNLHTDNMNPASFNFGRPSARQPRYDADHSSFPWPYPYPPFSPMCVNSAGDRSFMVHPWASCGPRINLNNGFDGMQTTATGAVRNASARTFPAHTDHMGDHHRAERLSQAAEQLKQQVTETKQTYQRFYAGYKKAVAGVQSFASESTLSRLWEEKVQQKCKYKTAPSRDGQQFTYQRLKLVACLDRVCEAAQFLSVKPSGCHSRHDRRELYLEKIRAARNQVDRLAGLAFSDEAACKDLIDELNYLGKIMEPEGRAAEVLYRFDKREDRSNGKDGNTGCEDKPKHQDWTDGDDDNQEDQGWDNDGDKQSEGDNLEAQNEHKKYGTGDAW